MHVIIVGAGPSGLGASLGLSSLGCTVDLLEKHPGFDVRGSTLGLAPNGIKALKEICPNENVPGLTDQGIPLFTGGSLLAWWIIRDWLLERVRNDPNITLHMSMTLESIDDESDESTVKVVCKERDFTGDLLIGADGVNSKVRSLLGLAPNPFSGYYVWRGSADAEGDPILEPVTEIDSYVPFGFQLWGTTTACIFNHHPKLPKRLNWVITADEDSTEPGVTTPLDLLKPHMDDDGETGPIYERLFEKATEHELIKSYAMCTTTLPPDGGLGWGGEGRITLIGDAAHAIRPASGQGTAMAFEDCAVLRRNIKQALDSSPDSLSRRMDCQKVLRDFENERLERLRVISNHEHKSAEASHRGEQYDTTEEYKDWLYSGI